MICIKICMLVNSTIKPRFTAPLFTANLDLPQVSLSPNTTVNLGCTVMVDQISNFVRKENYFAF